MPGAGNPAAWNRYGYVMYNPVKYTDPSGHQTEGVWCMNHPDDPGCRTEEIDGSDDKTSEPFVEYLFDPLFGPYFSQDLSVDEITNQFLSEMIINISHAYLMEGINYEQLAQNGIPNVLTGDQVRRVNDINTAMPLEVHLMSCLNHPPFFMFLVFLGEETGENYLSGNNWEMNFEPLYLNALMNSHPEVLRRTMEYYIQNYEELGQNIDFENDRFSDFLDSTYDDIYYETIK